MTGPAKERDAHAEAGPISHDEAEQIALAYIDKAFGNPEKPGRRIRHCIPANPREDTDIRLMAYIEQQRAKDEPRGELRASERQGVDAIEEGELVRVLTEVMREADRKFESVGGSTRHHVRDCLIPELEAAGLAVVHASSLSAARWVDCEERMPEAGQFGWIVWHGVVQEQPWEYTELDDGRMGWVHVESEITDGVSMWMPLPAPPGGGK